jgi:hypothetical protein
MSTLWNPTYIYVGLNLLGNLHWGYKPLDPLQLLPSEEYISLRDVTRIIKGKESPVWQRRLVRNVPENVCISIVTPEKTLDIQAFNPVERDCFVLALEIVVAEAKVRRMNLLLFFCCPESINLLLCALNRLE